MAVLGVVLFHLWPSRLTGGYVGVDVFFVISGFLITGHLLREQTSTGRISLPQFWARRARRLLPAALTVLTATTIALLLAVPAFYWNGFLKEIAASTLYVENWTLASDSVDYLAESATASPVQHYWSLSVEEQFYLVWPVLMIAAAWFARRRGIGAVRTSGVTIAVLSAASLAFSIWFTAVSPAPAYFVTPTRVWEFGIGALLALMPRGLSALGPRIRAVTAWIGLLAIGASMVLYSATTPFPSGTALLPALGAALVILTAEPEVSWAPHRPLGVRPVQWIGTVSYSAYLWHWPILILLPLATGTAPGTLAKFAILVATFVLAAATARFVETPFRARPGGMRVRPRRVLGFAGAGMCAVLILGSVGAGVLDARQARAAEAASQSASGSAPACFGAAARQPAGCTVEPDTAMVPDLGSIANDTGSGFRCDADRGAPITPCHFGSTSPSALKVALVGDSHGAVTLTGLTTVLPRDWSLTTYLGGGCVWGDAQGSPTCDNRQVLQKIFETGPRYDVILISATRYADGPLYAEHPVDQPDPRIDEYLAAWKPVSARGTKIIVIRDNPAVPQTYLDCLVRSTPASSSDCAVPTSVAYRLSDATARAAAEDSDVGLVDLGQFYCDADSCPLVIGNVVVYRDTTHLTATFTKTLAPYLLAEIRRAIATTDPAG